MGVTAVVLGVVHERKMGVGAVGLGEMGVSMGVTAVVLGVVHMGAVGLGEMAVTMGVTAVVLGVVHERKTSMDVAGVGEEVVMEGARLQ